jgi:Xaa-Pro aminopeptidase
MLKTQTGRGVTIPVDRDAVKSDLNRRVHAAQAIMRERRLAAIVAACAGAPHHNGWIRYFTAAEIWGGRLFLILTPDTLERHVIMRSTYDAEWVRQQAFDTVVESTLIEQVSPVDRTIQYLADVVGPGARIGMLNSRYLSPIEHAKFTSAFPADRIEDVTDALNLVRQIKSAFEIEAIRETGRILADGLDLFARLARPGRLAAEVAGEVDGYLKARGCFWGRVKYSLDQRPYTIIAPPHRKFTKQDVILFQFVHSGPLGYWYELASVFSFRKLPTETARRVAAVEDAFRAGAKAAVPGGTYRQFSAAVDRAFVDHGFSVVGKHTFDCHSIGTDETEGSHPIDDWEFKEDMVLGTHPATLLEGGYGFLLCENFLVQPGGAVALSPLSSFHREIAL